MCFIDVSHDLEILGWVVDTYALFRRVIGAASSNCYDQLVLTKPSVLIRLEGAAVLALSVLIYRQDQFSWLLFAAFFLAPDLSMLGYLANVRVGASVYNFVHTLFAPGVLIAIANVAFKRQLSPFALIWIAHIGFDRMLGFGLKFRLASRIRTCSTSDPGAAPGISEPTPSDLAHSQRRGVTIPNWFDGSFKTATIAPLYE